MNRPLAYLGLDVHKKTITAALFKNNEKDVILTKEFSTGNNRELKVIKELNKEYDLRVCYEAGCTGFGLYRQLTKANINCSVIAPSSIPRNDTLKTDLNDAKKLGINFKTGNLKLVNVPDLELEQDRDLIRFRDNRSNNLTRIKQQIKGFLLRKGISYEGKNEWNKKMLNWLGTLNINIREKATLTLFINDYNYHNTLVSELD